MTKLDKVECAVSGEKDIKIGNKGSEHFWTFTLSTKDDSKLHYVALINDANRHHFSLVSVKHHGRLSPTGAEEEDTADSSQKDNDFVSQIESPLAWTGQEQVGSSLMMNYMPRSFFLIYTYIKTKLNHFLLL